MSWCSSSAAEAVRSLVTRHGDGWRPRLTLSVARPDGAAVPLLPVMNAFAHLVAFDVGRSGFAHIHPDQTDVSRLPDRIRPTFTFRVTIPTAGRYVIWSQVNLGGTETFAPFWFDVSK